MPDPTWPLRTVTAATETPRERQLRLGREALAARTARTTDRERATPTPDEGTTP